MGSGVAIYTKEEPIAIKKGLGIEKFDEEGRTFELGEDQTGEYQHQLNIPQLPKHPHNIDNGCLETAEAGSHTHSFTLDLCDSGG